MNTYRRHNGEWCIQVTGTAAVGDAVTVTRRNGTTENLTLGAFVAYCREGKLFRIAQQARQQEQQQERLRYKIGVPDKLWALFDRASQHLKFPGIVLNVPGTEYVVRVQKDKYNPELLSVTDRVNRRRWYGRIHRNGDFELAGHTPLIIASRLGDFAANPAKVAAEHGALTGRCCFCNLPLEDERSTGVGYGPVCAGHFGLPWGDRPEEFAAPVLRRA